MDAIELVKYSFCAISLTAVTVGACFWLLLVY